MFNKNTIILRKEFSRSGMSQKLTLTPLDRTDEVQDEEIKEIIKKVTHKEAIEEVGWWCNNYEVTARGYGLDYASELAEELEAKDYRVKRLW